MARVATQAHTPLARALAASVRERAQSAAHWSGPVLQRSITVGATTYALGALTTQLQGDWQWEPSFASELARLDATGQTFTDIDELWTWLDEHPTAVESEAPSSSASELPSAEVSPPQLPSASSTPVRARRTPKPKAKAAVASNPPELPLARLMTVARYGGTPGQRYDCQGYPHVSVTFSIPKHGTAKITGLHRTLGSGSHIFWAKHAGNGVFRLSTSGGSEIESIRKTKALEDAWKAVSKIAKRLGCEAVEPVWS